MMLTETLLFLLYYPYTLLVIMTVFLACVVSKLQENEIKSKKKTRHAFF